MWLDFIRFIIQIAAVYFLASLFQKNLFRFNFLIFKSQIWAIRLLAVFLLPGTIVHELSHWLLAELLRVPTGEFSYMPQVLEDKQIRVGSLQIAKSNFIKRTLIGIAPFISGLGFIYFLSFQISKFDIVKSWPNLNFLNLAIIFLLIYLILVLSNTMFSSAKDLELALPFFILLAIVAYGFVFFKIEISSSILETIQNIISKLNQAFLLTLIIDLLAIIFIKAITLIILRVRN